VLCGNASPWIIAYPWSSSGFGTKYANPSTPLTAQADGVDFSPSGAVIAIGADAFPWLSVYEWNSSTGFGLKYANPATTPSTTCLSPKFNPNGNVIAVGTGNPGPASNTPILIAYAWSDATGFGTRYTGFLDSAGRLATNVAWSTDGGYVGVSSDTAAPYFSVFPWTGSGFGSQITPSTSAPAQSCYGVAWSTVG
jgi:hypothetical protein